VGARHIGDYVYFIPYQKDGQYHANVLRYHTTENFQDPSGWSAFDAGNIDSLTTKGYKFSTFDGQYMYFAPYHNNTNFSGNAIRYDTSVVVITPTQPPPILPTVSTNGIVVLIVGFTIIIAFLRRR
ncbi:hypothetical protein K8T06_06620, partial [bacterium]|nr:hypothetical protein [bacterium]